MDLETYKKYLQSRGTSRRDRTIQKAKHDTLIKAVDSPAYKQAIINGAVHNIMVISSTITTQKIIRTLPGDDFELGGIMEWSGSHWLITERDADDEITVRGKIEQCQREVVWQNTKTHEIISRWATAAKPYFSNLSENKIISYSSREFKLQMQYDEETKLLNVGKRLMLEIINGEPKTYRITCVDQMTERLDINGNLKGFLVINVEQDAYDANVDNKDLMICDYVDPSTGSTFPEESGTPESDIVVTYSGDASVKAGGTGKFFYAKVDGSSYDACVWAISSSDDGVVPSCVHFADGSTQMTGEKCKVTCTNNKSLIGKKLTLTATNESGKATEVEVEVVSL